MTEKYTIPSVVKDKKVPITPDMIPEDRRRIAENKILLINPPIRMEDAPHHIPYGLAQLSANLDLAGYDVGILDVNINRELIDWDLFKDAILAEGHEKWGFIGFGGLVTTYSWQKQAIKRVRKLFPNSPIVVGGGCFTSLKQHMMQWNPDIDVGVIGEADVTILELAKWLIDNDGDPHNIKGIIFRKYMEESRWDFEYARKRKTWRKVIETATRPLLKEEELDKLPYPYLDSLDLQKYWMFSALPLSPLSMRCKRRIDVISERGCPHRCTFCFHNDMGEGRVRFQSPKYIVNMISYWRYKWGIDFVSFLDENITANRKRCLELCELMDDKEVSNIIYWGCLGRVDNVDQALLERMHQSGCVYISYGGESASKQVLDEYRKKTTPNQMRTAIQATISAEINPIMTFMVGAPNEDIEDLLKTVKFWIDQRIRVRPFFVTPYPRTQLFQENQHRILNQYSDKPLSISDVAKWTKEAERAYEKFVMACGDATKFTANISKHFNDVELAGLRELMSAYEVERIIQFGKEKYGFSKSKVEQLRRKYRPKFIEPFSMKIELPPALASLLEKEESR